MQTITVHNEFTGIIEQDGEWYIGYCVEIPGANGQGKTVEECKKDLSKAVDLILKDRRKESFRTVPKEAIRELITV